MTTAARLNPRPAASAGAAAQERYDEWHHAYPVDTDVDTPWHQLLLTELTPEYVAGKRMLEIACGRGGLACRIASVMPGPRLFVAADFSRTAVEKGAEHARRIGIDAISWEVADAQQLPYPDAHFDVVISCETIEHLPDPRKALAEFARVLEPGGRLFLTCPNYLGPLGAYRGYMRLRGRRFTEEGQPINRFLMLPFTRRWIRATGLRIERVAAVGHYVPWPGRPPVRISALDDVAPLKWFAHHSFIIARKNR